MHTPLTAADQDRDVTERRGSMAVPDVPWQTDHNQNLLADGLQNAGVTRNQ